MPKRKLSALEKVDADLLVIRSLDSTMTDKSTAQTSSIKFGEIQRERFSCGSAVSF